MSEIKTKHPSYGLVSFCRITGNPGRLFGSPLTEHQSFVRLSIGAGERIHNTITCSDRYYGRMRGEHIEVVMSCAQFAELITTMNIGLGTPCTIRNMHGSNVLAAPDEPTESEHVRSDFRQHLEQMAESLVQKRDEVRVLLDSKKNLGKHDRVHILNIMSNFVGELSGNLPFVLDVFSESAEKVAQHAKAEVDAFFANFATQTRPQLGTGAKGPDDESVVVASAEQVSQVMDAIHLNALRKERDALLSECGRLAHDYTSLETSLRECQDECMRLREVLKQAGVHED